MNYSEITQNGLTNVIFCGSSEVEKLKNGLKRFLNLKTISHFFILEKGIDEEGNLHEIIQSKLIQDSGWYDYIIPIMKDIDPKTVCNVFANIWNVVDAPIILGIFIANENISEIMAEVKQYSNNKYNVISYPQ